VTRRPAILAVDGGGSKVDAAILGRDGKLLGASRIRLADVHDASEDGERVALRHLVPVQHAIEAAARGAGIAPDRLPLTDLGVFCLAGADYPSDERRLKRWVRERGWTANDLLRNDTFAVLRAGTDRPWGVGVVCGSGINCSAIAPDGRVARFPALGPISGDWGGGGEIGGLAAWHAMRAEDGRGPKTSLARSIPAHFGLRRPEQLTRALYTGQIDERRFGELAPLVFAEAVAGDAVARSVTDRLADEIVAMASALIRRLRMTRLDVEVVLGGGIFRNDDAAFFTRIETGLATVAPSSTVHVLTVPPVIGAALIGLDQLKAGRAAHDRVRAALTHRRLADHTSRRKE
jgi:N-acetylglucosamine kinase-like BadF-type ATPase